MTWRRKSTPRAAIIAESAGDIYTAAMLRRNNPRHIGWMVAVLLIASCQSKPAEVSTSHASRTTQNPSKAADEPPSADGIKELAGPLPLMDAMVGQINGEPIYASTVFRNIAETLSRLGQDRATSEFRITARQLIELHLQGLVTERLLLGEAQQGLTSHDEQQLRHALKETREELIRENGEGSATLADERLRQQHGVSLEQMLEDKRREMVVRRHYWRKLLPRINVSWHDVSRYYYDHVDKFRPPPQRQLRLIMANSNEAADRIDQLFAAGKPFAEVARDRQNKYHRENAGFDGTVTPGDAPYRQALLNEALVQLKPGEHSARIEIDGSFWWVHVESLIEGQIRTLRDSQLDIKLILKNKQIAQLTKQFNAELLENGSFDPIPQMTDALMEVAMARYAKVP